MKTIIAGFFAVLSITGGSIFGNAAGNAKKKEGSLEKFERKLLASGDDHQMGENICRVLGIQGNPVARADAHHPDESVDGRYRSAHLIVRKEDSGALQPIELVLMAKKKEKLVSVSYWFRLTPSGELIHAFRDEGQLAADGKAVEGSGIMTDMDPSDAKRLLKVELDYWLKGKGQIKPKKTAKSS